MRVRSSSNWGLFLLMACFCFSLLGCKPTQMWGIREVFGDKDEDPTSEDGTLPPEEGFESKQETAATEDVAVGALLDPSSDPDFVEGRTAMQEKRFQQAKASLSKVVERYPNSSEAYRWLGDAQYNLMELKGAIQSYGRARALNPENYFARRGEGLSRMHYGHELYKTPSQQNEAHSQYREALDNLQQCLREYPGDPEAVYGRAMAAEGASRLLYSTAVSRYKKEGRIAAEPQARNCLEVIDEGIESARARIKDGHQNEVGPHLLMAGLFLRRAYLLKTFERTETALQDLNKAIRTYEKIVGGEDGTSGLAPRNAAASRSLVHCRKLLKSWESQDGRIGE